MKQHISTVVKSAIKLIPLVNNFIEEKHQMKVHILKLESDILNLNNEISVLKKSNVSKIEVFPAMMIRHIINAKPIDSIANSKIKRKPPFSISWLVPPMGVGSGGHTDIFRTIAFLESKGHKNSLYFYDPTRKFKKQELINILEKYPKIKAKVHLYAEKIERSDIVFATHWTTAYPVASMTTEAKKYYYVQDYEPLFEPSGSNRVLAENTYRLGLRGLTLGQWLTDILRNKYGMQSDYFNFGVEPNIYRYENDNIRNSIIFYARPTTPRRGFELGIIALDMFHRRYPNYKIHIVGADVSNYKIPFKFINHGVVSPIKLNKLYNQCFAGLTLSFSNMSLIPLEMIASGCLPIVNSAPYTKKVPFAKFVQYSEEPTTPVGLYKSLVRARATYSKKKCVSQCLQGEGVRLV